MKLHDEVSRSNRLVGIFISSQFFSHLSFLRNSRRCADSHNTNDDQRELLSKGRFGDCREPVGPSPDSDSSLQLRIPENRDRIAPVICQANHL